MGFFFSLKVLRIGQYVFACNNELFTDILLSAFNSYLENVIFSSCLKVAEVVLKTDKRISSNNYQPKRIF